MMDYYNIKVDQVQAGLLIGILLEKFATVSAYRIPLAELINQLQDKYDNSKCSDCGEKKRDTENLEEKNPRSEFEDLTNFKLSP